MHVHIECVNVCPQRMYLVMELCTGGELADVLKEHKMFAEAETKQIMLKLAGAIAYLHRHGKYICSISCFLLMCACVCVCVCVCGCV